MDTTFKCTGAWSRGHDVQRPTEVLTFDDLHARAVEMGLDLDEELDLVWLFTPADADGFRDWSEMWVNVHAS